MSDGQIWELGDKTSALKETFCAILGLFNADQLLVILLTLYFLNNKMFSQIHIKTLGDFQVK